MTEGTPTPAAARPPLRWLAWLPNGLSVARLLLGLAFPFLPVSWRLAAVLLAALSDWADGAASRLLHAGSAVGRLLDPLADKIFLVGVLATFLADGTLAWYAVLLLGLRDVCVGVGALAILATGRRAALARLRPSWLGKATTAAQFLYLLVLLVGVNSALLLGLTAGLGFLATLDYARRSRQR